MNSNPKLTESPPETSRSSRLSPGDIDCPVQRRARSRTARLAQLFAAVAAIAATHAASAYAQPADISSSVDVEGGATFAVREETYALSDVQFDFPFGESIPGFGIPVEMLGVVVAPTHAPGPRPVAIFIHGQNASCWDASSNVALSMWPCPPGAQPVPSHRGFLSYQRLLAAQGWITLSISANGISGNPIAQDASSDTVLRAQLVEAHLRRWAEWSRGDTANRPAFFADGITPDLQRLMLIGHSRGGSAANQVALKSVTDSGSEWRARALVLIAPVAVSYNPAPGVPVVVLLPACDGDVTNLQGQSYVDRAPDLAGNSTLRTAVFIEGANHAWFNSEWDPMTATALAAAKDDAATLFEDRPAQGACRPEAQERLSGEAQLALGRFYVAAAGKALVLGDSSVVPLLDGSPVCAGPSCGGRVLTQALGGRRQPLLIPDQGSALSNVTPCLTARDVVSEGACITAQMPEFKGVPRTPHFGSAIEGNPPARREPTHVALRAQWGAAASAARIGLSHAALDADVAEIALRVIVDPEAVGTAFALTLVDSEGHELNLGTATLDGLPSNAGPGTGVYWAQEVHFALDRSAANAAGFALDALVELQLVPQSPSGLVWVLDAWGFRPGLAADSGAAARFELSPMARIDAAGVLTVPITVHGELQSPAEIYYYLPHTDDDSFEDTVIIPAGATNYQLELPLPANAAGEFQPQVLGVRGIVATRRMEWVKLQ